MKILGIDYGRAKIGLAISEAGLAEPWKVLRVSSVKDALVAVSQIVKTEQTEKVVVGVSEGKMGEEQKNFVEKLSQKLAITVETWDETLSTRDAQRLAIEAGVSRGKRRELEDAFASCVMLQSYLDQHGEDTSSV